MVQRQVTSTRTSYSMVGYYIHYRDRQLGRLVLTTCISTGPFTLEFAISSSCDVNARGNGALQAVPRALPHDTLA